MPMIHCESCHKDFESDWTEEEAEQEARELWGELKESDRAVVHQELIDALAPFATQLVDEKSQCHYTLVPTEKCGRCSLILRARAVLLRANARVKV